VRVENRSNFLAPGLVEGLAPGEGRASPSRGTDFWGECVVR